LKRLLLCILLGLSLVNTALSQTDQRLALVIGNAQYSRNAANLANPVNDARLMASVLTDAGFKVNKLENARAVDMQRGIAAFVQQLKTSQSVGVFYYTGQAVGVQGEHYLLPSDTEIDSFAGVQKTGITLRSISAQMQQAKNKLNILVVDANADDPFKLSSPAQQANLLIPAPPNTVIAISAKPPTNAEDGKGNNGLYTENLAQAIRTVGADLNDMFMQTEMGVREQSSFRQLPWSSMNVAIGAGPYFKQKPVPQGDDPKVFGRSARGG
jgi:uncharacterized caspase-like protein